MKIGYTCGVYDLFHVGHLNLFERCKEQCDYLIVGVCSDDYVRTYKKQEPVIKENDRTRIVNALKCVDKAVVVSNEEVFDKLLAWEKLKFDVLFSGDDWKGTERFLATEKAFKERGIELEMVFFSYTQGVSTSQLKKDLKDSKK